MKLYPVLSVSTNGTGSHRTLFPVGTRADALVHDIGPNGEPTYAEGVFVEMVSLEQAAEVLAAKRLVFSSENDFLNWLSE